MDRKLPVPSGCEIFKSAGGRSFTLGDGVHSSRFAGDKLWSDCWPIFFDGKPAGKLFRNLNYGTTKTGEPRWQATIRELYWKFVSDAPVGVGFDVAAFDTPSEALAAWGRSADQILDWSDRKEGA